MHPIPSNSIATTKISVATTKVLVAVIFLNWNIWFRELLLDCATANSFYRVGTPCFMYLQRPSSSVQYRLDSNHRHINIKYNPLFQIILHNILVWNSRRNKSTESERKSFHPSDITKKKKKWEDAFINQNSSGYLILPAAFMSPNNHPPEQG